MMTLFDSGANLSCINPLFLNNIESPVKLGRTRKIYTAAEGHFIEVRERVSLDFYLEDVLLSDEFLIVPGLSEEAIIGAATMQKWRIKLDYEHDQAHVDPTMARLQLKKSIPYLGPSRCWSDWCAQRCTEQSRSVEPFGINNAKI